MGEHKIKKKGPDLTKPDIKEPAQSMENSQNTQHNTRRESLGPNAGRNQQN